MTAVESYNRPGPRFRTALYVVLIVMAWQAFFHAYFYRKNQKPWYQSRQSMHKSSVRYQKVDGEPKHWDLDKCMSEYFGNLNPPERKNLEFLLGLRNKIEHRDLPQLDVAVYGECQAALLNLENYLVQEFGLNYALTESLAISLQFSRSRPSAQQESLKSLAREAQSVLDYIERFKAGLSDHVLNEIGYAYRVFLIPKVANHENTADAAVEFVRTEHMDEEQRATLRKLTVLIKDKQVPVSNLELKRPAEVVKNISSALPFVFNMHHHTRAWKYFEVRPNGNSDNPKATKSSYCVYDRAHNDYLYTNAWIRKLTTELTDSTMFRQVTGQSPVEKY